MGIELLFLLIPAIFCCGMIGFATLAIKEPKIVAARWVAGGFALAILSAMVDSMRQSWPADIVAFSLPLHWCAVASFMQAFMVRRGVRSDTLAIIVLIVAGGIANIFVSRVHYFPDERIALVNGIALLIIAHCVFRLRHQHQNALERIVIAFILAIGFAYAVRLFLYFGAGQAGDHGGLATWSHYKIVAYFSASILALCAALVLGVALGADAVRLHDRGKLMDGLTGIPNRYAYDAWLQEDESCVSAVYAAALMIDIDHFKAVNDSHGHAGGDAALKRVAETLAEVLEPYGHLARIGGEEFALLVHEATALPPGLLAESARTAVQAAIMPAPFVGIGITISIGHAIREVGQSMTQTLRRADMALYQAKISGRNRCVCASSLDPAKIMRAA
jgi:diguanylate cyclase (GGDEF)-like protein